MGLSVSALLALMRSLLGLVALLVLAPAARASLPAYSFSTGGRRLSRGRYRLLATPAGGRTRSAPFRIK
jgi:hypothetical protein